MGVIHGRFQVLHHDHLKYLTAGKARCRHLVVGITNPDPTLTRDDPADPQRSQPAANPLSYFERYVMIQAALLDAGLGSSDFSVVPFPINLPGELPAGDYILKVTVEDKIGATADQQKLTFSVGE